MKNKGFCVMELAFEWVSFALKIASLKLKVSKGAPLFKKLIGPVAPDR